MAHSPSSRCLGIDPVLAQYCHREQGNKTTALSDLLQVSFSVGFFLGLDGQTELRGVRKVSTLLVAVLGDKVLTVT